jgi:phosphoheptose isomerase
MLAARWRSRCAALGQPGDVLLAVDTAGRQLSAAAGGPMPRTSKEMTALVLTGADAQRLVRALLAETDAQLMAVPARARGTRGRDAAAGAARAVRRRGPSTDG